MVSGDSWPHDGWTRHRRAEWERRAGDPQLTYWLRVAALAYARHGENNHASFKRGDVALILGTPMQPYTNVRRAIADAVAFGWLAEGSYWGCLIVPAEHVRRGSVKQPLPVCFRCEKRNRSLSERNGGRSSTPDERFRTRIAH